MPARKSSPLLRALGRATRHFLHRGAQALARTGLQISAVLYALFAAGFAVEGWRSWRADQHRFELPHHALLLSHASPMTEAELALALVFAYFALSSWTRALHHN